MSSYGRFGGGGSFRDSQESEFSMRVSDDPLQSDFYEQEPSDRLSARRRYAGYRSPRTNDFGTSSLSKRKNYLDDFPEFTDINDIPLSSNPNEQDNPPGQQFQTHETGSDDETISKDEYGMDFTDPGVTGDDKMHLDETTDSIKKAIDELFTVNYDSQKQGGQSGKGASGTSHNSIPEEHSLSPEVHKSVGSSRADESEQQTSTNADNYDDDFHDGGESLKSSSPHKQDSESSSELHSTHSSKHIQDEDIDFETVGDQKAPEIESEKESKQTPPAQEQAGDDETEKSETESDKESKKSDESGENKEGEDDIWSDEEEEFKKNNKEFSHFFNRFYIFFVNRFAC